MSLKRENKSMNKQASDSFYENKCDSTMDTTVNQERLSMSKSEVDQYGNQLKPQKLLKQISEVSFDELGQNYLPSDDAREGDDFQSSTENLPKAIY